jgi:hypothetical protein
MRETGSDNLTMAQTLSRTSEDAILRNSGQGSFEKGDKAVTVAVTTAPRKDCTLAYCLASIEACGWSPIVFAEPGSTETDYQTVWNEKKLGIWHNWLNVCRWAIANSSSDYVMTVQDDSLFHSGSKTLVDNLDWPEDAGFVSLYTPRHYSRNRPAGVNRIYTKSLWGACALIFRRDVLEKVLTSNRIPEWFGYRTKSGNPEVLERRRADTSLVANSDTVIGKIMNDMGLAMYFVEPSPVQHIAQHSTISHGGNSGNRNCFPCADFDKPLLEQVWK